jgi:filamentous hemagglutinin
MYKKGVVYFLIVTMVVPHPSWAGGISIDSSAPINQQATLDQAQNGVPVVNISDPSQKGISSNKFSDYNVNKEGVIINNSTEIGLSELGGALYRNPNFQSERAASVVLFQVTGTKKSDLNGYQEMFGQSADFILANPNGIQVNGGGFINTPRATLSTGQASVIDDRILLDVQKGMVRFEGKGINVSNVDRFDVIARSIQLHAQVYGGKQVSLKAGGQTVDYTSDTVQNRLASTENRPEFAIDVSELGGVSAGQIYLVSTEEGVGVRTRGDVVASVGDILIESNGDIGYRGLYAKRDINVVAKGAIEQTKGAYAERDMTLKAGNALSLKGRLEGDRVTLSTDDSLYVTNAEIRANSKISHRVVNQIVIDRSYLEADEIVIETEGTIETYESRISGKSKLTLSGEGHRYSESVIEGKRVVLDSTKIVLSGSQLVAENSDVRTALWESKNGSNIAVKNQLKLSQLKSFSNKESEITVGGRLDMGDVALDDFYNRGQIKSKQAVLLRSKRIRNEGELVSESDIVVNGDSIKNTGKIQSNADLTMHSETTLLNSGSLLAVNTAILTSKGDILNDGGKIMSNGGLQLTSTQGKVTNKGQGLVYSEGDVEVNAYENVRNENSQLSSKKKLAVVSVVGDVVNQGDENFQSRMESGEGLKINAKKGIVNSYGNIGGGQEIKLAATGIKNGIGGMVEGKGDVHFRYSTVFVNHGEMVSEEKIMVMDELGVGRLTNTGQLSSGKLLKIGSYQVNNTGKIQSNDSVSITSGDGGFENTGIIQSNVALQVDSTGILSNFGSLLAVNKLKLTSVGELINDGGKIMSNGGLQLSSSQGKVTNTGQGLIYSEGDMEVNAYKNVRNENSQLSSKKKLSVVSVVGDVVNQGDESFQSRMESGEGLKINANKKIENGTGGMIEGKGNMNFSYSTVFVNHGEMVSEEKIIITDELGEGWLTNTGQLSSGKLMEIGSYKISNTGEIQSNDSVSIRSGDGGFENIGSIQSNTELQVDSTGILSNLGSLLAVNTAILTSKGDILNDGGKIMSNGGLQLTSSQGRIVNKGQGLIYSEGDLEVNAYKSVRNENSQLSSKKKLLVVSVAEDVVNQGDETFQSRMESGEGLKINANKKIENGTGGMIEGKGNMNFSYSTVFVNHGKMVSEEKIMVTDESGAGLLTNTGHLLSGKFLKIGSYKISNTGEIQSNDSVSIRSGDGGFKNTGSIQSNTELQVDSTGILSNSGSLLAVNTAMLTSKGDILNDGGKIMSNGGLQLTSSQGRIANTGQGLIYSEGDLEVNAYKNVRNENSQLSSTKKLSVMSSVGDVVNQGAENFQSRMDSGEALKINSKKGIVNGQGGVIEGKGNLNFRYSTVFVNQGKIVSEEKVRVTDESGSGLLTNTGQLSSGKLMQIESYQISNTGKIQSNDSVSITSGDGGFENRGIIQSNMDLVIDSRSKLSNSGLLLAVNTAMLTSKGDILNDGGKIMSNGDLQLISSQGRITNTGQGLVYSEGDVEVNAYKNVRNKNSQLSSKKKLVVLSVVGDVVNQGDENFQSRMESGEALKINAKKKIVNNYGNIVGGQGIELAATEIENGIGGIVEGKGNMNFLYSTVFVNHGKIVSEGQITIMDESGAGRLTNTGQLSSGKLLKIGSYQVSNTGKVQSNMDLIINSETTLSNLGSLLAVNTVMLISKGDILNDGGKIMSNGGLQLISSQGKVTNMGQGLIYSEGNVEVNAYKNVRNENSQLSSKKKLVVVSVAGDVVNQGDENFQSRMESGEALKIKAKKKIVNNYGNIVGGQGIELAATEIENGTGGMVEGKGDVHFRYSTVFVNHGKMVSEEKIMVTDESGAGLLTNTGYLLSGKFLKIGSYQISNTGKIQSNDSVSIRSGDGGFENTGLIQANMALQVNSTGILSNFGSLLAVNTAMLTSKGDILNDGGNIMSNGGLQLTSTQGKVMNTGQGLVYSEGDVAVNAYKNVSNKNSRFRSKKRLSVVSVVGDVVNQGDENFQSRMESGEGLKINAKKKIVNSYGTIGGGQGIKLFSEGIENGTGGMVEGKGNVNFWYSTVFVNRGKMVSEEKIMVMDESGAGLLTNTGQLSSGKLLKIGSYQVNNTGKIQSNDSVLIRSGDGGFENTGLIQANMALQVDSTGILSNLGSLLAVNTAKLTSVGELINDGGKIMSNGGLQLSSSQGRIINTGQGLIYSEGDVEVNAYKNVSNENSRFRSKRKLSVVSVVGDIVNGNGGRIDSDETINLSARGLENHGDIKSKGIVTLQMGDGGIQNLGGVDSEGDLIINSVGDITNDSAKISAGGKFRIITDQMIYNRKGTIESAIGSGISVIDAALGVDNTGGVLWGNSDLTLKSLGGLVNRDGGSVVSLGRLDVAVSDVDNRNTKGDMEGFIGVKSVVFSKTVSGLDNREGTVFSGSDGLTIRTIEGLNNQKGNITSLGKMTINVQKGIIDNSSGKMKGADELVLVASTVVLKNSEGEIQSGKTLEMTIYQLMNKKGSIKSDGILTMFAHDSIDNTKGVIGALLPQASGESSIKTIGALLNTGGELLFTNSIKIDALTVDNRSSGKIKSNGSIVINSTEVQNNSGLIYAQGGLMAHNVNNESGTIESGGNLTLTTDTGYFYNEKGIVSSFGSGLLSIQAATDIANTGGRILSNGDITLDLQSHYDITGTVSSSGFVTISAESLTNYSQLFASKTINLETTIGDFINKKDAMVFSNQSVVIKSKKVQYNYGDIIAVGDVTIESGDSYDIDNQGTIQSSGTVTLTSGDKVVNSAKIESVGDLTINTGALDNQGKIASGGNLMVKASGSITNGSLDKPNESVLFSMNKMSLLADDEIVNYSNIFSLGDIDMMNRSEGKNNKIYNYEATIEAEGNMVIKTKRLENTKKMSIVLRSIDQTEWYEGWKKIDDTLSFDSDILDQTKGESLHQRKVKQRDYYAHQEVTDSGNKSFIGAKLDMTIDADYLLNDAGIISAGKDISIDGNRLDNTSYDDIKYYRQKKLKKEHW